MAEQQATDNPTDTDSYRKLVNALWNADSIGVRHILEEHGEQFAAQALIVAGDPEREDVELLAGWIITRARNR